MELSRVEMCLTCAQSGINALQYITWTCTEMVIANSVASSKPINKKAVRIESSKLSES
jgi:hypothetical protein